MVSQSLFREFIPTHTLPPGDRAELARHSHVVAYQPGQEIFHRGEAASSIAYLVSGEVELVSEAGTRTVRAATEDARHALSHGARYAVTATALRPSQVLFVDREQMDLMLTWAQTGSVEVQDLDEVDPGDWMGAMLRNPAFHRIPAANIAQIIAAVEQVEVPAGQAVIRQGEPGDYYWVLTAGRCRIVREPDHPEGISEEIDDVGPGRGFGEEALVSGEPRNATVETVTDCSLARLASTDFERLLKEPLLSRVKLGALPVGSLLVDVRLPEEYERGHLPGAINVPLYELRRRVADLDAGRQLSVYCDTGRRSASAVFLFRERGLEAHLVEGGVGPEHLTGTPR